MARAREHTERHHPLPPMWSIATNARFPTQVQRRVWFMMWVGRTLAARFPGEESGLLDNWIERVMPSVVGPAPLPTMLTPAQERSVAVCRRNDVCMATQKLYEDGFNRLGWSSVSDEPCPCGDVCRCIRKKYLAQVVGALGYFRRMGAERHTTIEVITDVHNMHSADFLYSCNPQAIAKILSWSWPEASHRIITHLSHLEALGLVRCLDRMTRATSKLANSLWVVRGDGMNGAGTRVNFDEVVKAHVPELYRRTGPGRSEATPTAEV